MARDNMAAQERRSRIGKLRKELENLERQENAEASRPGPKNRDVEDGQFEARVWVPPKASDIFPEEPRQDPVRDAIENHDPTRRRRR